MRIRSGLAFFGWLLFASMRVAWAQGFGLTRRAVAVAAVSVSTAGYVDDSRSASSLLGGYGYVAFSRLMLGAQAGTAMTGSPLHFAVATLGYPARVRRRSQVYPFFAAGAGNLPSVRLAHDAGPVFGAGVGVERVHGRSANGAIVGVRGGYLYRSGDGYERAIYLAFSIGASRELGHERVPAKPPVLVAGAP